MKRIVLWGAALLLAAGCVSYEYKGEKGAEPTTEVAVFMNPAKVKRTYQVLGEATVSADYRDVPRDRLMKKLISEAEKNGADAVLIVEQQVLPYGSASSPQGRFLTAFDYDETNQSWSQVYRDVDQRYGRLFGNGNGTPAAGGTVAQGYRRIIRAEFLKYTDAAVPGTSPADAPKDQIDTEKESGK